MNEVKVGKLPIIASQLYLQFYFKTVGPYQVTYAFQSESKL